jgi:hypothetical protein
MPTIRISRLPKAGAVRLDFVLGVWGDGPRFASGEAPCLPAEVQSLGYPAHNTTDELVLNRDAKKTARDP